ncbi:ArdC family protein [Synechococcus sp. BA-132 BA5]|uniref:ArdC family protein n=1 Tax=Synechococcus sp. BA-132 BA5 TaxID=3110252 RepID=UPI002B20C4AF|nr:zincin-like metallopeptidase domain-containing protein [Synechococcus sp. BA-132 BA5]MEA5416213.1 zincin-like metallopeptidase domain-containing protein [Synechococcus sp. BA-132 BA5]
MAAVSSRSRSKTRSEPTSQSNAQPPADKLVEALIQLLEAGTTPWRREWDSTGGGHHVNLLTGHRYQGANPILLCLGMHLRGSGLPYWCGFAEARAQGIFPRKGSQGVRILRPQLNRRSEAGGSGIPDTSDRTSASNTADATPAERTWISFRPVVVFNAGDLDGDRLGELIAQRQREAGSLARPEPERLAAAESLLGAWPVPVSYGGERACYLPQIDRIQLPERRAFLSAAGFYATWAHEAIHSTGHTSRLNRDLSGRCGSKAYAREELVAELGSVLLGDRLEIGSALENHAAYLGHWIELLRQSPHVLYQVLGEARQAVELVVGTAGSALGERQTPPR